MLLAPALAAATLTPRGASAARGPPSPPAGARVNANATDYNGFEYMPALGDKDYGKARAQRAGAC